MVRALQATHEYFYLMKSIDIPEYRVQEVCGLQALRGIKGSFEFQSACGQRPHPKSEWTGVHQA